MCYSASDKDSNQVAHSNNLLGTEHANDQRVAARFIAQLHRTDHWKRRKGDIMAGLDLARRYTPEEYLAYERQAPNKSLSE